MNTLRTAGFILLILLFIWLSRAIFVYGGGLNLKNLLLIVFSGIIIFVPLYKKYFKGNTGGNNKS